jgi:hypothetical protein
LVTKAEAAKDRRLKSIFNSSLEQFMEKMREQNFCCAICERPFATGANPNHEFNKEVYGAFQDHDHACCPRRLHKFCGKCNRGLLCYTCNKFVVGIIEKMKIPADRLLAYIQKWAFIEPRENAPGPRKRKRKRKRKGK